MAAPDNKPERIYEALPNDRSGPLTRKSFRSGGNPWLVAAIVVVPTFMEVLDTTIAVVALRYIARGLSATVNDGEWVLTSYLAANAIILPITGWLSTLRAPQLLPPFDCRFYC